MTEEPINVRVFALKNEGQPDLYKRLIDSAKDNPLPANFQLMNPIDKDKWTYDTKPDLKQDDREYVNPMIVFNKNDGTVVEKEFNQFGEKNPSNPNLIPDFPDLTKMVLENVAVAKTPTPEKTGTKSILVEPAADCNSPEPQNPAPTPVTDLEKDTQDAIKKMVPMRWQLDIDRWASRAGKDVSACKKGEEEWDYDCLDKVRFGKSKQPKPTAAATVKEQAKTQAVSPTATPAAPGDTKKPCRENMIMAEDGTCWWSQKLVDQWNQWLKQKAEREKQKKERQSKPTNNYTPPTYYDNGGDDYDIDGNGGSCGRSSGSG